MKVEQDHTVDHLNFNSSENSKNVNSLNLQIMHVVTSIQSTQSILLDAPKNTKILNEMHDVVYIINIPC